MFVAFLDGLEAEVTEVDFQELRIGVGVVNREDKNGGVEIQVQSPRSLAFDFVVPSFAPGRAQVVCDVEVEVELGNVRVIEGMVVEGSGGRIRGVVEEVVISGRD